MRSHNVKLDRKNFNISDQKFETFDRLEVNGVRHYHTPTGDYPSVTTVLGAMTDKSYLDEWRKRVGDEQADFTSRLAASRGTNVHTMCENYVRGTDIDVSMPFNLHMFKQIKRVLDRSVDNVVGCELTLVSSNLKVAGSCDLIAEYDGILSVIDYKTSSKNKTKDMIEGYFLQASLYAYMFWEMTGMPVKQIVVAIAVEEENEAQVFVENPRDYLIKAVDLVKSYHKLKK